MIILNHHEWQGPPWVLATNVEDFGMSAEKIFQTLAKGNATSCQNSVLERQLQGQELLTPLLLKSDKENSYEQRYISPYRKLYLRCSFSYSLSQT